MNQTCGIDYVDHVGIAVYDLEVALEFFRNIFGLESGEVSELIDQGVKAALVEIGETRLELLEPLNMESPVGRFLERRGEGLHHLAFNVKNVKQGLELVRLNGLELIDRMPRQGLTGSIAFIHPKSTHGILTELVQSI